VTKGKRKRIGIRIGSSRERGTGRARKRGFGRLKKKKRK